MTHKRYVCPGWMSALMLVCSVVVQNAFAQSTDFLELETIAVTVGGPVTFEFSDRGTGASGYTVQSASAVGDIVRWEEEADAVVESIGGDRYRVTVAQASPNRFYRVVGENGQVGTVQIGFASEAFSVDEGGNVSVTITFSGHYAGTIRYRVEGTADAGDYSGLTGEIQVDGTTATIPVSLADNGLIGEIKQVVLTLQSGDGVTVGPAAASVITILENDAEWQGSLVLDGTSLGFVLKIRKSGGIYSASLKGDGTGFFPAVEVPATITFTADSFEATAADIALPAESTLLDRPMNVTLKLEAANGVDGQNVSPTLVTGAGSLTAGVPSQPSLGTVNDGTFTLIRPSVALSTSQVELVDAP